MVSAHCKMKMPRPLSKNHDKFQDGHAELLKQAWGPSEPRYHLPRKS